ncbi:hypothetical protein GGF32_002245 [Allomyces javanicus]|nr:hypothetical protein GGF32_002245 [Allomyces javanicus]
MHANVAGRTLTGVAEMLGLLAGRALPRGTRIEPLKLLSFVGSIVSSERDLLRFNIVGIHVNCLQGLQNVASCTMEQLFSEFNVAMLQKMIRAGEVTMMAIRDATECLAIWGREYGGAVIAALTELCRIEQRSGTPAVAAITE